MVRHRIANPATGIRFPPSPPNEAINEIVRKIWRGGRVSRLRIATPARSVEITSPPPFWILSSKAELFHYKKTVRGSNPLGSKHREGQATRLALLFIYYKVIMQNQ